MGLYSHYEWRKQTTKPMYGRICLQTYTLVKIQGHIFWTHFGVPLSTLLSILFQTVGRTLKITLGISVTVFCDVVFGATSPPAWTQASCLIWLKSNLSEGLGITVSNYSCFWMWSLLRYSISLVPTWASSGAPGKILAPLVDSPLAPKEGSPSSASLGSTHFLLQHRWSGTSLSSDKGPTSFSLALSDLPGSKKAT